MKKQEITYETKFWVGYEIKNSFEVLDAFIDRARIDYYKQILSQAVLFTQKQEVYNKEEPGQLFMCHSVLRSFLRACSRLQVKSKKWKVMQTNSDCKSVLHQASMNKEEYQNPFIVFHNAFTENSLHELENKLAEIVYLALLPQQVDYNTDLSTAYIHIVKLLDAAQLMRERGLEKSKKQITPAAVMQQESNLLREQDNKTITISGSGDEDKMPMESQSEVSAVEEEPQNDQNQITTIITATIAAYGIYCFGERKTKEAQKSVYSETKQTNATHYYVLVIVPTMPQNITADLAFLIKTQTKGRCTATLLIHTLKDLRRDKSKQALFFQKIVFEGVTWFEDWSKTTPLNLGSASKREFKKIERYWLDRKIIVDGLINSATALDPDDAEILKITFLHQTVEQLCLGLIHTFLGYRPHHFALSYLFDLCDLFTSITSDLFPRKTQEELTILKPLFSSINDLRHFKTVGRSIPQLPLIEERCMAFYEQAVQVVEIEIKRLKELI